MFNASMALNVRLTCMPAAARQTSKSALCQDACIGNLESSALLRPMEFGLVGSKRLAALSSNWIAAAALSESPRP